MTDNRWLVVLIVAAVALTGFAGMAAAEQRTSGRTSNAGGSAPATATATPATTPAAPSAAATQVVTTTTVPVARQGTVVANVPVGRPPAARKPAAAALRLPAAGDIVRFGRYNGEQLSWRILGLDAKRVVLLSVDAVIAGPYQSNEYAAAANDYASSSIRAWLNEDFVPEAFGEDAEGNSALGRSSASDAFAGDIAYLLTPSQLERYLPEADDRAAGGTPWSQANAGFGGVPLAAGSVYWWLAPDPGSAASNAAPVVQTNGAINRNRYAAIASDGVRPAIKLNAAAVVLEPVKGRTGEFTVRVR